MCQKKELARLHNMPVKMENLCAWIFLTFFRKELFALVAATFAKLRRVMQCYAISKYLITCIRASLNKSRCEV